MTTLQERRKKKQTVAQHAQTCYNCEMEVWDFIKLIPKQALDNITAPSVSLGTCRVLFYLLIRPVFWSEVTARLLEP